MWQMVALQKLSGKVAEDVAPNAISQPQVWQSPSSMHQKTTLDSQEVKHCIKKKLNKKGKVQGEATWLIKMLYMINKNGSKSFQFSFSFKWYICVWFA